MTAIDKNLDTIISKYKINIESKINGNCVLRLMFYFLNSDYKVTEELNMPVSCGTNNINIRKEYKNSYDIVSVSTTMHECCHMLQMIKSKMPRLILNLIGVLNLIQSICFAILFVCELWYGSVNMLPSGFKYFIMVLFSIDMVLYFYKTYIEYDASKNSIMYLKGFDIMQDKELKVTKKYLLFNFSTYLLLDLRYILYFLLTYMILF